jgi:hypothetical protein
MKRFEIYQFDKHKVLFSSECSNQQWDEIFRNGFGRWIAAYKEGGEVHVWRKSSNSFRSLKIPRNDSQVQKNMWNHSVQFVASTHRNQKTEMLNFGGLRTRSSTAVFVRFAFELR